MKHRKIIALAVSLTLVSCFFVVPVSARQSPVGAVQTNLNREQPNVALSLATKAVRKVLSTKAVQRALVFGEVSNGSGGRRSQLILPAEVLD